MKTWKKGVIKGVIWGVLSLIASMFMEGVSGELLGPMWAKLLILPVWITWTIGNSVGVIARGVTSFYGYYSVVLLAWVLFFLGPLVFGSVIGVIAELLYGRWKEKG